MFAIRRAVARRAFTMNIRAKSTGSTPPPKDDLYGMEIKDFRKPWVYKTVSLVNWLVIPAVAFYSVFFYDWGDGYHVFTEPQRWMRRQQEAFFSLSPEQQKIVDEETRQLDNAASQKPTSAA